MQGLVVLLISAYHINQIKNFKDKEVQVTGLPKICFMVI